MKLTHAVIAGIILSLAAPAFAFLASPVHIIPVVAKVKGQAGTDWRSDAMMSNVSDGTLTVGIQFFRENQANTFTGSFAKTLTLAPGETRTVEDILGSLFPSEGNTKGMLLIMVTDSSGPEEEAGLALTTRTYNAADPSKTYGQTIPSNFFGMVFGLGRSVITGVREDSRFRTNIGVANLSPTATSALIKFYNSAGALISEVTRSVPAMSLAQWKVSDLGVNNVKDARVEIQVDPSMGTFDPCSGSFGSLGFFAAILMPYFSMVDNGSGDAVFGYGQLVFDEFADTCGTTPTDDCEGGGSAISSQMVVDHLQQLREHTTR
jgi:hypothetical protein